MDITAVIAKHKNDIIKKWHLAIIETYPNQSRKHFLGNKNKFSNPVGYTIENSLPAIVEAVINKSLTDEAKKSLDDIIKIRAVQDFKPADALNFVFGLRAIIISEIFDDIDFKDFLKLEKIFHLIVEYAINSYVNDKERIFEIKANEQLKTFEKMVERLNKKYDELTSIN